jgi:hypothetical protein
MSPLAALKRANWIDEKRATAYPVIFLLVYVLIAVLWVSGSSLFPPHERVEFSRDFVNVYAAGTAVREGRAAQVYDWDNQKILEHQIEQSGKGPNPEESYIPWLYPPMFLGVAWILAFLPYYGALAAYLIAGFAAYAVSIAKLARAKQSIWAIAAFPGVCSNLFVGQNGFITTALLGAGLYFLDASPIAAGVFFGLLSYKPHFFILIPIVLAASRSRKALFSTLASASICAGLSLAAFGLDSWRAFFNGLPAARAAILENTSDRWLGIMHTAFSAVRMFGGSLQAAYAVQAIVAVLSVLFLIYIWSRRPSLAVRASSLCGVLLLASPYSFGYDQVLLAIPIALLAKEGAETGFLNFEKLFLFALWLLPAFAKDTGEYYALPLTPPMLAALLYFCWKRQIRETPSL